MSEEQRRAEELDRAAEDWITANGRWGEARINNQMHRAFLAGYDYAGQDVARLHQDMRKMESDFRVAMATLQRELAEYREEARFAEGQLTRDQGLDR